VPDLGRTGSGGVNLLTEKEKEKVPSVGGPGVSSIATSDGKAANI